MLNPRIIFVCRLTAGLLFSACLFSSGSTAQIYAQQPLSQSAQQHYDSGWKHLQQHSYPKALQEAEAASKVDPDFAPAFLLKSQALVGIFKKQYNTGAGLSDLDPSFMLLKQAADDLRRYIELSPATADAKALREQLESLRAYANLTDQDDASRTVFRPKETTIKAHILSRASPKYGDINGAVILLAVFTADKQVNHIIVLRSLSDDVMKACVDAARNTKFEPAIKDGRAVSTVIQMEFHFNEH